MNQTITNDTQLLTSLPTSSENLIWNYSKLNQPKPRLEKIRIKTQKCEEYVDNCEKLQGSQMPLQ